MTRRRWIVLLLVLLGLVGPGSYVWWITRPPPPPPVPTGDTGMSEEQRIRMMEEIGYIQQEGE